MQTPRENEKSVIWLYISSLTSERMFLCVSIGLYASAQFETNDGH